MSDIVIQAENLGKKYTIGHQTEKGRYLTLRDVVGQNARTFWRTTTDLLRGKPIIQGNDLEEVWALKDVNFEIRRGEVVGVIGRNGAGKSTLLKVLSRITEPSTGRVTIKGRVSSLLEVGTGFHPELTGRENVYLNGAILGMTRAEVKRKFDEIVAFAEIEKFLDTPVKRYSSGMYVRLAFAVAAHLEPEILVVDEVLAVGDAAFQKKCLGKMGEVAKGGRTVLFVSHSMPAVSALCEKAVWLDTGYIKDMGATDSVVSHYLNSAQSKSEISLQHRTDRKGTGDFRFLGASILDSEDNPIDTIVSGQQITVALDYSSNKDRSLDDVIVLIRISDLYDYYLFTLSTHFLKNGFDILPKRGTLLCHIPFVPLVADVYSMYVGCSIKGEVADAVHNVARFTVIEHDVFGSGKVPLRRWNGPFIVPHRWSLRPGS